MVTVCLPKTGTVKTVPAGLQESDLRPAGDNKITKLSSCQLLIREPRLFLDWISTFKLSHLQSKIIPARSIISRGIHIFKWSPQSLLTSSVAFECLCQFKVRTNVIKFHFKQTFIIQNVWHTFKNDWKYTGHDLNAIWYWISFQFNKPEPPVKHISPLVFFHLVTMCRLTDVYSRNDRDNTWLISLRSTLGVGICTRVNVLGATV